MSEFRNHFANNFGLNFEQFMYLKQSNDILIELSAFFYALYKKVWLS